MKVLQESYDNYVLALQDRTHPECFTEEEFKLWYEVEVFAPTKPRLFPCRDCTPNYHQKMLAEGRCCQKGIKNIERIMSKD